MLHRDGTYRSYSIAPRRTLDGHTIDARCIFERMVRRRAAFNPLEPSPAPRWYVVRNMHGAIIDSRPLVAGANLTHVFITAMLAWMEGGWTISEFSSTSATFFCIRDLERRMISIDPTDPYEPQTSGASHLSGNRKEYE